MQFSEAQLSGLAKFRVSRRSDRSIVLGGGAVISVLVSLARLDVFGCGKDATAQWEADQHNHCKTLPQKWELLPSSLHGLER
jgi:hypothetical protein